MNLPKFLFTLLLTLSTWVFAAEEPTFPTIEEATKKTKAAKGFFTLWQGEDKLLLEIQKNQLDKDFLFFSSLSGGQLGYMMPVWTIGSEILYFRKIGKDIALFARDAQEIAQKNSPEHTSVERSFLDRLLYRFRIAGAAKGESSYIIEFDDFLFQHGQLALPPWMSQFMGLMGLDERSSFVTQAKAFPENLEIEVQQTLRMGAQQQYFGAPNQVRFHYSFVNRKKSDYRPRPADERVGYFTVDRRDWNRLLEDDGHIRNIIRWNLQKADPDAAASVVKQPIVFHLDKSIPFEYRPFVRAGILEWNKAFEKLGYIGALEARLPESGAEFDPADSRYATVSWASNGWAVAFGPVRNDPETGEILDADVVISAAWISAMDFEARVFGNAPAGKIAPILADESLPLILRDGLRSVSESDLPDSFLEMLQRPAVETHSHFGFRTRDQQRRNQETSQLLSLLKRQASRLPDKQFALWKTQFIGAYLKDLTMHEVGHALGLRHNFKASAYATQEQLKDKDWLMKNQVSASVMDYNDLNVLAETMDTNPYVMTSLGEYDFIAIEYGYKDISPKEMGKQLNSIAQGVVANGLEFATDEDMSGPDPLVNVYDLGKDPVAAAAERLNFVQKSLQSLEQKMVTTGSRYDDLDSAARSLVWSYYSKIMALTSNIGGIYMHRDRAEDPKQRSAKVPVTRETHLQTMDYLMNHVFSEPVLEISTSLLQKARSNPWNSFVPSRVSSYRSMEVFFRTLVIWRLLSSTTLANLAEFHELVMETPYTRAELFASLHKSIIGDLSQGDLPSEIVRQTQVVFVTILAEMVTGTFTASEQSRQYAQHILEAVQQSANNRVATLPKAVDFSQSALRRHLMDLSGIATKAIESVVIRARF